MKRGVATVPCTRELFDSVTRDPKVKSVILEYRRLMHEAKVIREQGDPSKAKEKEQEAARLKSGLPGFCFQADTFDESEWVDSKGKNHGTARWRKQKTVRLNGLYMIDVDHVENPMAICKSAIEGTKQAGYDLMLAFITPSGEGCKMVFSGSVIGGNLYQHQQFMAKKLGITIDDKCKDASRLSFTPMAEDIVFIDDYIFSYYDQKYAEQYDKVYNERIQNPTFSDTSTAAETTPEAGPLTEEQLSEYRYQGLSIDTIINLYMEGKPPAPNTRHDTLLKLVRDLRHVCEKNEQIIRHYVKQLPWVQDLEKEGDPVDQTISDAMGYRYYPSMPKKLEKILAASGTTSQDADASMEKLKKQFALWGRQIRELWDHYPCLKECCSQLEPPSYPAALFVGGSLFGTLATRTWYYFYHRPEKARRLNYGIFVISDPATGKSFAGDLFDTIMEPVLVSDQVGNDATNDYKRQKKMRQDSSKEQKKEALPPPDFPIRIHGTRTANGVFIEHMVNCKETVNGKEMHLHLFTFDSELDSATAASKGGQWIDKSIFELKAFHNELDDQQYKNVDSVSGPFKVYWNYLYTGTPLSLSRKVTERNFGSGLYGRLACIPLCADTFKMLEWQNSTKDVDADIAVLHDWAYRMDKVQGCLPLGPLVKVAYDWCEELMTIGEMENDRRIPMLCKRVPYYGINIAAPFVLMRHWEQWEKDKTLPIDDLDKQLVTMIMDIQYYCQQYYFGKFTENYLDNQRQEQTVRMQTHKNQNLESFYNSLPKVFTKEDLDALCRTPNYHRVIIHRWLRDGKIKKQGKGHAATYEKKLKQ